MNTTSAFRRLEDGGAVLVVDPSLEGSLREMDLLSACGFARAMAGGESLPGASGRGQTRVIALPGIGRRLHLRPVVHGGWLAGLWGALLFGPGRAIAELEATARLHARGVPVPRPALAVAHRRGGLWTAALGTLHEEKAEDGIAFLRRRPDPSSLLAIARAAGQSVREFHDAGGRHADLHAGNLLVREEATKPRVLVIDLDGARIVPTLDPARRMAELMRLQRSLWKHHLMETVGTRGCAAFFAAYLGGDRPLRRAMLAHRKRESARLAAHRLGYRIRAGLRLHGTPR